MKKTSSKNKKEIQIQELTETNFVKYTEIESPLTPCKESISGILFVQLYTEIDLYQLFTLKMFSQN